MTFKDFLKVIIIRHKKYFFLLCFISLIVMLTNIAVGIIEKKIFDSVTKHANVGFSLITLLILIVAARSGRMIIEYASVWSRVCLRLLSHWKITDSLIKCIFNTKYGTAFHGSSGEMVNRIRDDIGGPVGAGIGVVGLISSAMTTVIALSIMAKINVGLTAGIFAPLMIIMVIMRFVENRIRNLRRANREISTDLSGFIGEVFRSVLAIKVGCAENRIIKRFENMCELRKTQVVKDQVYSSIIFSIYINTVQLGTGFIFIFAGQAMRNNHFSVGDLALFQSYLWMASGFINEISSFILSRKQAIVSVEKINSSIDCNDELRIIYKDKDPNFLKKDDIGKYLLPPLEFLKVDDLTYSFPQSKKGIHQVSFTIKRGSCTVITGQIGSGKTTLLRSLLGLLPSQGQVYWNTTVLVDRSHLLIPPHCSYTPQIPVLFSGTLRENIVMGSKFDENRCTNAIKISVLDKDLENFDNGIETIVGPRGRKLSGGQAQRAAAARMFYRDAQLYVFDDLSSALDIETELSLWNMLMEKKFTYLMVSHRRQMLERADQILLLHKGELIGCGTLTELLDTTEEMEKLYQDYLT